MKKEKDLKEKKFVGCESAQRALEGAEEKGP